MATVVVSISVNVTSATPISLRLFTYQLLWWTKRSQLAHDKVAALHKVLKQWRTTE